MSSQEKKQNNPFVLAESFRASRWLEDWFSFSAQKNILILSSALSALFALTWLIFTYGPASLFLTQEIRSIISVGFILSLIVFMIFGSLRSFYLYYRLSSPTTDQSTSSSYQGLSYSAADIILSIKREQDPLIGFTQSRFGREVCLRSGVYPDDLINNLDIENVKAIDALASALDIDSGITLFTITEALFDSNERFSEGLLSGGVTKDTLLKAARWMERTDRQWGSKVRFWSPERLAQITPLTQDFVYGNAYTLQKFSRRFENEAVFLGATSIESAFSTDIEAVLNILSRPRDANALLVGHSSGGVGDIIMAIKSRLQINEVPALLTDRKLYVLDAQALIAAANESKGEFEYLLNKLMIEATLAGNVVLVMEDIVQFRIEVNQLSVNLMGILSRYLDHSELPIIFTSSTADYHQHLEGREMMSSLGTVLVHDVNDTTLLKLLGEVAVANEGSAVCTVRALEVIAHGARTLITDDEMPHAAIDLLLEILSTHPNELIDEQTVNSYLSQKTGVPTGKITDAERVSLSGLENELKKRVIGQDMAVKSVASALRRNRAGVEDEDRPIGTFLFLGPTGVGKTETAKTLNRVYFSEMGLNRLDMSEYSQVNAIDILRGSAMKSGRLADMVREKPYGVLLLDEFEKAHQQVHDLFLQILDEGHFTDGNGRRVSLDNMIIIATSNAGSQQIFSYVESGDNLVQKQRDIIDSLVAEGEFRPELINRFDSTVIFHPLTTEDLMKITEILLQELNERMKNKGYRLDIDSSVVSYLVERGYNPEFGARAIKRVIQDTVENVIANKIINESLTSGDKITLTASDLNE